MTCADPGIFVRGGGGSRVSLLKKSSDNVFFFFFLVLSLFYRSQMVNFKEKSFYKLPEGVQHFPGGFQLFPGGGGSNRLFPIQTHITCDFPGGVRTPCPPPPLDPHLDDYTKDKNKDHG